MKILLTLLLHGLCGLAGYWLATTPESAAPPAAPETPPHVLAQKGPTIQPTPSPPLSTTEARLALLTPEDWPQAISLISQMRLNELPHLLRELLQNPFPDVRRRLLGYLFERWATLDQSAALAAMRGLSSPQQKERALRAILDIWTRSDVDAAWQYVTAMEDDSVLQEAGIETLLSLNVGADPLRYAAWAAQLEDIFLREKALIQIADSWMQKDPEGALAAALTVQPQRLRDYLLTKVCYRDKVDHAIGLDAIAQLPTQAQRSRLSADWLGAFADQKPQAAFQWLLHHADRTDLQKSAETLGGILAVKTPRFADLRALAQQLPPGPLRDAFASRAADEWASSGHPLTEAAALLALSGPCLERDSAQHTLDAKRAPP